MASAQRLPVLCLRRTLQQWWRALPPPSRTAPSWNWAAVLGAAGGAAVVAGLGRGLAPRCDPREEGHPLSGEEWWTHPSQCSDQCSLWRRNWQPDWDGRAPPPATEGSHDAVRVRGRIRHLLLIRHGQYDLQSDDHGLTDLGREQSRLLGERLAAWAKGTQKDHYGEIQIRYAGIWVSDIKRAMQTAEILGKHLPGVQLNPPDPMLAEGMPTVPHPTSRGGRIRVADVWEEGARIEGAFRKYVHRDVDHKRVALRAQRLREKLQEHFHPEAKNKDLQESDEVSKEHTYEIYVCHMNVIRYFVMRSLQLPPEAWLRLRGDNTGITEIIIHPDGSVVLGRFADTGHLPINMITFH